MGVSGNFTVRRVLSVANVTCETFVANDTCRPLCPEISGVYCDAKQRFDKRFDSW